MLYPMLLSVSGILLGVWSDQNKSAGESVCLSVLRCRFLNVTKREKGVQVPKEIARKEWTSERRQVGRKKENAEKRSNGRINLFKQPYEYRNNTATSILSARGRRVKSMRGGYAVRNDERGERGGSRVVIWTRKRKKKEKRKKRKNLFSLIPPPILLLTAFFT